MPVRINIPRHSKCNVLLICSQGFSVFLMCCPCRYESTFFVIQNRTQYASPYCAIHAHGDLLPKIGLRFAQNRTKCYFIHLGLQRVIADFEHHVVLEHQDAQTRDDPDKKTEVSVPQRGALWNLHSFDWTFTPFSLLLLSSRARVVVRIVRVRFIDLCSFD